MPRTYESGFGGCRVWHDSGNVNLQIGVGTRSAMSGQPSTRTLSKSAVTPVFIDNAATSGHLPSNFSKEQRLSRPPAWFDPILRAAGSCPFAEAANPVSPCHGVAQLGLRITPDSQGRPVRWTSAAGWGNPDGDLYIIGSTPRHHLATEPGANYAPISADREAHAQSFARADFRAFLRTHTAKLRESTRWSIALAEAWFAPDWAGWSERVFFAEMLLCPQPADPPRATFLPAARQCMSRHLLPLLNGCTTSPKRVAVIIGARAAATFFAANNLEPSARSERQPVTYRPADHLFPVPIIAALAPQAAKLSGLSRSDWINAILAHRP